MQFAALSDQLYSLVAGGLQLTAVERFVVVHGQIILNQFKHFPNKAIQNCAFVNSLKTAMEARKHSKLYSSTKKAIKSKSVNRNPMKVSSALLLAAASHHVCEMLPHCHCLLLLPLPAAAAAV